MYEVMYCLYGLEDVSSNMRIMYYIQLGSGLQHMMISLHRAYPRNFG